jgi:hypothetical protein
MKKLFKHLAFAFFALFSTGAVLAQGPVVTDHAQAEMKTYVIERNIPGAGQFSPEKLKDISKTSCSVLKDMGPGIQWVQSYVTGDKIFCVYKAQNIDLLKEHAKRGGFPITNIYEVSSVICPARGGTN